MSILGIVVGIVILLIAVNAIVISRREAKYWKVLYQDKEWEFEKACHVIALDRSSLLEKLTDSELQRVGRLDDRVKHWMDIDVWKDWRRDTFHSKVIPEMKAEIAK